MKMKLIDLLVQQLPSRGGWPEGVCFIAQDGMGILEGHHELPKFIAEESDWSSCTYVAGSRDFKRFEVADDQQSSVISREQYEAALAASRQAEWDGQGLPPVGERVEYTCNQFSPRHEAILEGHWYVGTIVAYYEGFVWTSDNGIRSLRNTKFRPIRTEAECRREDTKNAIAELCRASASNGHSADLIYDAIAAGKIPGIKLAD